MCSLQLIIPGSGLEAGTDEANKAALPPYAGVEGVDQVETQRFSPESDWTSDEGMKLPPFRGVDGVKQ